MGGLFSACSKDDTWDPPPPLMIPLIPPNVRVIGIAGKAGSGKDTLAEHLVTNDGFTRLAFADPLKSAIHELFSIPLSHMNHPYTKNLINDTWQKSPRQLLQWLGDCVRNDISKDFFVVLLAERIRLSGANQVVISDVRFEQEAEFIRTIGGNIIELSRDRHSLIGLEEAKHASEAALPRDLVDFHIDNNGTREELVRVARRHMCLPNHQDIAPF